MTFPEIFESFKNHEYVRRKCWHNDVFVQYRIPVDLIRLVQFIEGSQAYADQPFVISNDTRLTASDLFADDWVVKEEQKVVKEEQKRENFWDYVRNLDHDSDEWSIAMEIGQEYHDSGKDPNEYLEEIKEIVSKKLKRASKTKKK